MSWLADWCHGWWLKVELHFENAQSVAKGWHGVQRRQRHNHDHSQSDVGCHGQIRKGLMWVVMASYEQIIEWPVFLRFGHHLQGRRSSSYYF